jgi:ABC-type branched-subunit amino acid transport system ATPase component
MHQLSCINVSKQFQGVIALRHLSLTFPPSGIVAIIGPNGAGKSTLLNVLTGLILPDEGEIFLGSRTIVGLRSYEIAGLGIGRTYQAVRLMFGLSVLDNILLAFPGQAGEQFWGSIASLKGRREESRNKGIAIELLQLVDLERYKDNLARELSYGQQKVLALVCCMATGAGIILLDEPVAGIHQQLTHKIIVLLRKIRNENHLVVFVEHDMAFVKGVADQVIALESGGLAFQGRPGDFRQDGLPRR